MDFDIINYINLSSGKEMYTKAIQSAIDACAAAGGGRVIIKNGVYRIGTIILKSNVNLHIEEGAVLLGSPDCSDYPERPDVKHVDSSMLPRRRNACLIFAEECENISITGMGKIDCNGLSFIKEKENYESHLHLDTYYSYYQTLSSWLFEMKNMSLSLDKIIVSAPDAKVDSGKANIFERLRFSIVRFLLSFVGDYSTESLNDPDAPTIKIWVNWGRDQVKVLNTLIQEDFSPNRKINVKVEQVNHVKGSLHINEPKTKGSIRTIILSKAVLNVLLEYKKTVNSRWLFPSPKIDDMPRNPQSVFKKVKEILKKADCKNIRFHDLRHTFATTALANGMDVKTLSSIIGHVSSETTLDIYLHSTQEMQRQAASKIDRGIAKREDNSAEDENVPDQATKTQGAPKFEPVKGKIRKPGTGCITEINDHLYEGKYSPKGADGKCFTRHIYAKTRDGCEILLAEMIAKTKAEIQEAKEKLKKS